MATIPEQIRAEWSQLSTDLERGTEAILTFMNVEKGPIEAATLIERVSGEAKLPPALVPRRSLLRLLSAGVLRFSPQRELALR